MRSPTPTSALARALLLACLGLLAAPASAEEMAAGHIALIVIIVVVVFVAVGVGLGCVVWRQRRAVRRARALFDNADEVALDALTHGDRQTSAAGNPCEQEPTAEHSTFASVVPSRVQSRLARPGAGEDARGTHVQRREGEGEQAEGSPPDPPPTDDDAPEEADATLSGVPIEIRVRPRHHPPKGTVVVRYEDRQVRINFNRLAEIPQAEPPPLSAEELQRIEDEHNRVASPEFYGRGEYMDRRLSAPASPIELSSSFSSIRHLYNQRGGGLGARASPYAASSGSVASLNIFPPPSQQPQQQQPFLHSPMAGSFHGSNNSQGSGAAHRSPPTRHDSTSGSASAHGPARASAKTHQRARHQQPRTRGGSGWVDDMSSTSDDFDQADEFEHSPRDELRARAAGGWSSSHGSMTLRSRRHHDPPSDRERQHRREEQPLPQLSSPATQSPTLSCSGVGSVSADAGPSWWAPLRTGDQRASGPPSITTGADTYYAAVPQAAAALSFAQSATSHSSEPGARRERSPGFSIGAAPGNHASGTGGGSSRSSSASGVPSLRVSFPTTPSARAQVAPTLAPTATHPAAAAAASPSTFVSLPRLGELPPAQGAAAPHPNTQVWTATAPQVHSPVAFAPMGSAQENGLHWPSESRTPATASSGSTAALH